MGSEENELKAQIIEFLKTCGVPATKHQAGAVRVKGGWLDLGDDGWPDIIAVPEGFFVGIETKSRGGTLEKSQERRIAELRRAGAQVLVADDFDRFVDRFLQVLMRLRRG